MKTTYRIVLLAALLPLVSHASGQSEISRELDDARAETRAELARERARLDSEPLVLGDTLHFGKRERAPAGKSTRTPKGEITRAGDLLVDGKAVAIDPGQRQLLLGYRAQVIDVAKSGIAAGEKAALVAIEATDVPMMQLIIGGLTGSLEHRVESVVQRELRPAILQICQRLPALRSSQQALAARVPAFRPYATLRNEDIANCESDVRRDLAMR